MFELVITSSVLIAAIILLRRVLRGKISLRLQYALWALAAVRLLIPATFGSSPVSVLNAVPARPGPVYVQYTGDMGGVTPEPAPSAVLAESTAPASPRPSAQPGVRFSTGLPGGEELPANTTVFSITALLFPLWASGAGAMLVWFLWVNLVFHKKLRAGARRVDIPGCPLPVFVAEGLPSPCLYGLFRPAVYLTPVCLEEKARLNHVLTHELTHWRHKDPLWSLVRCLCLSIWWFHPLVWLAASLSRRDCELACDEGALARLGEEERTAYGRTLIGLMTVSSSPSHLLQTATTMADRRTGIKERLTLIAKKPKMAAVTAIAVVLIAAVTAVCTFTGAAAGPASDADPEPEHGQAGQALAELLASLPPELDEEIFSFTPENPPERFDLEEGELFRAYCKPYYMLSSALEPRSAWVGSLYRLDQDQYDAIFNDPAFQPEAGTGWECIALDGQDFYVLYAPLTPPEMTRMEELGQSAYEHTLSWLRETVLACEGMTPGTAVSIQDDRPVSDPAALLLVDSALTRMEQAGSSLSLSLTGEGHEPAGGAYGPLSIPNEPFIDAARRFVWFFAEDDGEMPHGDAISPVDWVLTASAGDGSVTFQFYPDSNVTACTLEGAVYVLQALPAADELDLLSHTVRGWYDSVELSAFQAQAALEPGGPGWPEFTGFGSDFPRYAAENLAQSYLNAYTLVPPGNQFHLDSAVLLSVEVYDMDDLDEPTRICFHASWAMAGDGLAYWDAAVGITQIEDGPYAGQWSAWGNGEVCLGGDGLWRVSTIGGERCTADDDGIFLPDIKTCSDSDLMYFLLNAADGAYAEGGQYELGERFLNRPEDILNTMTWFYGVQPEGLPDDGRDGADFLVQRFVIEFAVMRDDSDRERFAEILAGFGDEDCGGMVREVRQAFADYAGL